MNKKWIIIIGVVLGVVALGVGAYFAWQNRAQIAQVIPGATREETIEPVQSVKEKLNMISSREVKAYWVTKTATSSDIFYLDDEGMIFKISADGVETSNALGLKKPLDSMASPSGNLLFARINSGGDTVVYDSINDKHIRDFFGVDIAVWGAEEGKIAMITTSNGKSQLVTEDVKDSKAQTKIIMNFGLQGFDLQWPNKDYLMLTQKPSADYVSDMWKVDIKTKTLKKVMSERGLMVQWAPFGDRALAFTTTEGRGHKLSLIDNNGARLKEFRFVTLPDKCVMATASQIYCAIPRNQETLTHMVLPDDYLKRSVYFKDGIYQVDIEKDSIQGIYQDETPDIDAVNLTVMGNKLLFINRYDRKLYSLELQ